jgi:fibronectin type 3 domain-containing protein
VGPTLQLGGINRAHARLSWSGTPAASFYRVYRSTLADAGFVVKAETDETEHDDPEIYADGQNWFYLIRAVDACGAEGP